MRSSPFLKFMTSKFYSTQAVIACLYEQFAYGSGETQTPNPTKNDIHLVDIDTFLTDSRT